MHLHVGLQRFLLEHFTTAILYEGPATINLVNVIRNHSGLLQESWPDSSSDSYLPNKDIVIRFYGWALKFTGINDYIIPDSRITLVSPVEYTSFLESSM